MERFIESSDQVMNIVFHTENVRDNCTETQGGCNATVLSTTPIPTHRRPCGPEDRAYCFNGGNCELVTIGGTETKRCECMPHFIGPRCDLLTFRAKTEWSSPFLRTSTYIYIGIATLIVLAVFITLAVLWYRRYRRRRSHSMLDETTSTEESQKQDSTERSYLVSAQQTPKRWGTSNRGSTSDDIEPDRGGRDLEAGPR